MNWNTSALRTRGWIVAATALSIASLACSTIAGGQSATPTLSATLPTEAPATREAATEAPATTAPDLDPTEIADATAVPAGEGRACFIVSTNGQLHCVDSRGLTVYTSADFPLGDDYASDITECGTGFAIAYYTDIVRFDGVAFEQIPLELPDEAYGVDTVACDPAGQRIAVVATGGFVLLYENDEWQTFNMAEYDRDDDPDFTAVVDVALPDDHSLWVALNYNVARWDGAEWRVFEKGVDWEDDLSFTELSPAPDGNVVASFGTGLLSFEGGTPLRFDNDEAAGAYGMDVTADWILVGHGFGAYLLDRSGQTIESHPVDERPELPYAATIYSVAIDDAKRLWLGSTYNLLVIDTDGTFHSFRMNNTGMMDSAVDSLAVQGTPPLPPLVEQPTGALTGTVLVDEKPLAEAQVVACTIDFGTDPACSGDPNYVMAQTDGKGVFTFSDVPRGRYTLYVEKSDGEWVYLADADGYYLGAVFVDGEPVDLGEVTAYN